MSDVLFIVLRGLCSASGDILMYLPRIRGSGVARAPGRSGVGDPALMVLDPPVVGRGFQDASFAQNELY